MRFLFWLLFVFGAFGAFGISVSKEVENPLHEGASLGITVTKPNAFGAAQLPNLPLGVGFVVVGVKEDGAGAKAGLLEADLLWKLEDQMLINEGQLATLLRIWEPGETIYAYVYREGAELKIPIVLGRVEQGKEGQSIRDLLENADKVDLEQTTRVIDVKNRTAILDLATGSLKITRGRLGDEVQIRDSSGEVFFEKTLPEGDGSEDVPSEWKQQISALRRGLDQGLDDGASLKRLPRPRIVPPPPSRGGD